MADRDFVIDVDPTDLIRDLEGIKNGQKRAVTRAINRTLITINAEAARNIAKDIGLKVSVVKKAMRIVKANFSRLAGSVVVTGDRIPLIAFGATGPEPSRGRRGSSVTASIGGRSKTYPGAFIATVKAGKEFHRGVFVRRAASLRKSVGAWGLNLPIKQLFGPSLPRVASNAAIVAAVRDKAEDALQKNLEHEVAFLLSRKGA